MNKNNSNNTQSAIERLKTSFTYIKHDSMAGIVTGIMAIPLTVGICLMSDYPIMTGLYTVIFAGIISFITYLFKPGNYTGMPGVAAGLAPALAMGVSTFGIENMPFVILLTSVFQAVVWKFKLEKYILRVVPHYLVEGLLAGVGLKIALKFIPFLYDIQKESNDWFSHDRIIIIVLSILSFFLFIILYNLYKKKMPALPYFVIMTSGIVLSLVYPLTKISIAHIPFTLALPLPHFGNMSFLDIFISITKMIGFAIMLGSIDVIEQVMSNVAIEKIDPMKRKANTNNSLLAIWMSNCAATFFGGMTNLDGLAKSTTNTVAGAKTKLSNVFVSLFLLIVVIFPQILSFLPKYALGIIMVYSGWKMIANIGHVKAEGRYALIMASVCGLLVFKLGIFEGLLLLLFMHAIIQYIFMRSDGKTHTEIVNMTKSVFADQPLLIKPKDVAILQKSHVILDAWIQAFNRHDIVSLIKVYDERAVMIQAFSEDVLTHRESIGKLYQDLFKKRIDLQVTPFEVITQKFDTVKVDSGKLKMEWNNQGFEDSIIVRFNFVYKNGKIVTHHSSVEPSNITSVSSAPFIV